MTEELDHLLGTLLHAWPRRFRFRALLVALDSPEATDPAVLARSLVEGIASDQDEYEVFDGLVAEGRFALAEEMLAECAAFDRQRITALGQRLETVRQRRYSQLLSHIEVLTQSANLAGLDFEADRDGLLDLCRASWPDADGELSLLKDELEKAVEAGKKALAPRLAAQEGADAEWTAACQALIDAGRLRAADTLLSRPEDQSGGPATVPPLPDWTWRETPEELLRWHLDPATRRAPSFARWSVRPGSVEHRLLDTYQALQKGGSAQLAVDFATALDQFLGHEPHPKAAHPVEGGHLTSISGLFTDPDLAAFRPAGDVDLFVADAGTRTVPAFEGLQPFIAVGSRLEPNGYANRSNVAVLDLRSLLQLVRVRTRRPVGLLRLTGRQWPLTAFTADPLLNEPAMLWRRLSWIVDIVGLGDLTTTAALAFETGLDPELVRLFLDFLLHHPSHHPRLGFLPRWTDDPRMAASVRAAVLAPIAGSPVAETAFWTALDIRLPGEPVGVNDMMREIALATERPDPVEDSLLWAGASQLATLPVVREVTSRGVLFEESGVLIGLAADGRRYLTEALERLTTATAETSGRLLDAWSLYRHALTPSLATYHADPGPQTAQALVTDTDQLLTTDPSLDGRANLLAVLDEMRPVFESANDHVKLTLASPQEAFAAVCPEVLQALLYELLSNAAEAMGTSGGSVRVQATTAHGDLTIEVQDSGPGVADVAGDHRVFRKDVSTRGPGRGAGLHRARALAQLADGDLLLSARQAVHPILHGAHFKLVLPTA